MPGMAMHFFFPLALLVRVVASTHADHHPLSLYFFDPEIKYVTTTLCNDQDAAAQLWTVNATSSMIYLASDPSRCLSLVPNTANIRLADGVCASARVKGRVIVNGVARVAIDLQTVSKFCAEDLQEFGRWNNQRQFHDYANVVTSYDCPEAASPNTQQRDGRASCCLYCIKKKSLICYELRDRSVRSNV